MRPMLIWEETDEHVAYAANRTEGPHDPWSVLGGWMLLRCMARVGVAGGVV